MSAFTDIRAALEAEIASISGIPSAANRSWENVEFDPTTGTAWVRMTLLPGQQRPAVAGPSPQQLYQGIMQVDIYQPEGDGPNSADVLADAVRDHFTVNDSFTKNSTTVRIRWSERDAGRNEPPWYRVTVNVSWYTYRS